MYELGIDTDTDNVIKYIWDSLQDCTNYKPKMLHGDTETFYSGSVDFCAFQRIPSEKYIEMQDVPKKGNDSKWL